MGNCTSRKKKKSNARRTGVDSEHENDYTQPPEDVTYASIDHSSSKPTTTRATTAESESGCDYATVNMPRAIETDSDYATVNMPRAIEADCNYATVNVPRVTETDGNYSTVNMPRAHSLQEADSDVSEEDCATDDYICMN
ncbi:hypothetical protein NL108_007750 [Boleophthalmus pectinirostris]|nr:hypothetical protein NL108_007750 [Boleophthalmus pectinirostris]